MKFVNIKRRWALAMALAVISIGAAACGGGFATPPVSIPAPALQPTQAPEAAASQDRSPSPTAGNTPSGVSPGDRTETPKTQQDPTSAGAGSAQAQIVPGLGPVPGVEPDPDYEEKLSAAGLFTRGWTTDFSLHMVRFDSIISGGPPRDGIPPLDSPTFTTLQLASKWLDDKEPVISFEMNGDVRAYPLQILTWHEIVNDVVGDVPVAVTFCPLCNTAIVFDRRLEGVVLDFGTSGRLRNSDLIMWDRQTESWWQQLTGEAIIGQLSGHKLIFLPAPIISWADFKTANPQGQVLSKDTGFGRNYGRNPYAGYDQADNPPFLFRGDLDGRLLPKDRVLALTIGDTDVAFPFTILEAEGVVNYSVNNQDIAVFFKKGTTSALDASSISSSRDVGATGVFESNLDGRKLTFHADGDKFVDDETSSVWNILGQAIDGPLAGEKLTPVVHSNSFWFAVAAFKPDTQIYQGQD